MARRSNSLPVQGPYPQITGPQLSVIEGGTNSEQDGPVTFEDGAMQIKHDDGSVTVNFNPPSDTSSEPAGFNENLAKRMDEGRLSEIAEDLLDGIRFDEDSRKEWLDTRALAIKLLGLQLNKPRSDTNNASAPMEGMATIQHPALLEATVSFQATARAELLPATGPVKVRNDAPVPPQNITQDTQAKDALADTLRGKDDLAQALETDMNHYLTAVATEYVPDTDRMLFYVGFGGDGFKKVYNCPLRRRPVSESVDAEDLIVSDAATDLYNCTRVTHRIKMRKSTLRRMQLLGAYRDIEITMPTQPEQTAVDQAKEEVSGVREATRRIEDRDHEILEVYCELDLDEYAPEKFKGKKLPLPYRVTIERESRQVLDIRRNWDEDDEQCHAERFFVQFPFIRGLGFYGLGYAHLLGNTTNTLTAAWRLLLDNGMFANFPAFLYAKGLGRQNSNQFRAAPGTGVPIDINTQQSIKDAVMAFPYKEAGPAFTGFITHVEEVAQRLASTANIQVGEGKQDAPVGTTLALIEQASKVLDSAHKRLHAAQAEEFQLLKARFRKDPEAFWRHNKKPAIQWQKDQFIQALNECDLVPVADPNNPTSLHRIAKAMAIKTLQQSAPQLYDPVAVDMRIMRIVGIDPSGLFRAQPPVPPPDPRMVAIQQKAQAMQGQNQIALLEAQIKAATAKAQLEDKQADRASREKLEQMKIQLEQIKLQEEQIIHQAELQNSAAAKAHEMQLDDLQKRQEMQHATMDKAQELQHEYVTQQHEMRGGMIKSQQEIEMQQERHRAEMERSAQKHQMEMEHAREMHAAKLEAARQIAKVRPKPAKKDKS